MLPSHRKQQCRRCATAAALQNAPPLTPTQKQQQTTNNKPKQLLRDTQPWLPKFTAQQRADLKGSVTFLALNYYTAHYVTAVPSTWAKYNVRCCCFFVCGGGGRVVYLSPPPALPTAFSLPPTVPTRVNKNPTHTTHHPKTIPKTDLPGARHQRRRPDARPRQRRVVAVCRARLVPHHAQLDLGAVRFFQGCCVLCAAHAVLCCVL